MGGAVIQTFPPEVPWCTVVPADPSNYAAAERSGTDIDHIEVHITDGHADPFATAGMFQQVGHKASSHFIAGQAGQALQCVRLKDIAWHAHGANARGIAIEHTCRSARELGPDDEGLAASDAMYAAGARIAAHVCRAFGWQPDDLAPDGKPRVVGHREIDPVTTHQDCPDGAIDMDRYRAEVRAALAALGPLPQ